MAIEHDAISDTKRHEPKGISTATVGDVYIADGAGSGTWRAPVLSDISDYTENFGELSIQSNTTAIAVTAATDTTLSTPSDYIKVSGVWDATPHGNNTGITQNTNDVSVADAGVYVVDFWTSLSSDVASSLVSFMTGVNGTVSAQRRPRLRLVTNGQLYMLNFQTTLSLNATDVVSVHVACDKTANLTLADGLLRLNRIGS